MKIVRVPWIRCRADEVGSCSIDVQWKKLSVRIIAYSQQEAQDWWWAGLSDEERDAVAGLDEAPAEQESFW